MNLRQIDLNLLVIFDALMQEKNVTRAGQRVGLTQPAASNALNRLRHLFHDELLVRTPTGMQATDRAEELAPAVRRILREIDGLVETLAEFNPASAELTFHMRLSDVLALLILPQLTAAVSAEAPAVRIETVHLSPNKTVDALETGAIDLALSTGLHGSSAIREEPLLDDRLVCLLREGHPALSPDLGLDAFLSLPQIKVAQSPIDDRFVDNWLADKGLRRRINLTLPHWLGLPYVVRETDLIAVMSERATERLSSISGIQVAPLPIPDTAFTWCLYWHKRRQSSAPQRWLRQHVIEAASACSQAQSGRTEARRANASG